MTIQEFKDNGYVHLKNVLDEQSCKNLTDYLKNLVNQQQTIKDSQCPNSEAVHGAEEFDKLLEALTPYFEEKSGLKLYPTYSYARLYTTQNEILENHRDRPACEISATITLGFEGNVWSIYMGDNEDKSNSSKIDMAIGDAVMYRGCDKWHWREPYFEGKWQAQVFLHYVDANGPYAEWKYDKRESLGLSKTIQQPLPPELDVAYVMPKALSYAFCDKLIEEYSKPEVEKELPFIGEGRDLEKNINLNIRNVLRLPLPMNQGIGATLTSIGLNLNHEFWQFNITHSNQAEFLMYDINGKYEAHVDTFHKLDNNSRKITVLAILNDNFEGGKFYIQNGHKKIYPQQNKGDVIVFPSFLLHGVEPVTKGQRFTVVTWLAGPYFK
jgi:hypothetical protein